MDDYGSGIGVGAGVGVIIQEVVFGNRAQASGTGILYSRNPISGENQLFGEYLHRSEGTDVILGRWTSPEPIGYLRYHNPYPHFPYLLETLTNDMVLLEERFRRVMEVHFVIQQVK